MTVSGQSFFTPQTPEVRRHLWIVVSGITSEGKVAIANLSTKPGTALPSDNPGAVIKAKEHSSISRDCVVRCEEARLAPAADLDALLAKRILSGTKAAPPDLVAKIQQVLGASKLTPLEVKRVLREQGLITNAVGSSSSP